MLIKIDAMCLERDKLKKELPRPRPNVLGGRSWHAEWYVHNTDNSPLPKAL
jgi:hypothetical protein